MRRDAPLDLAPHKPPTGAAYRYHVVAGSLNAIASGTDGLWEWYRIQMTPNMVTFGCHGDVALSDYVAAHATDAEAVDRLVVVAFVGLASRVGVAVSNGPGNG